MQCSLPSCTAPSQASATDELGKRYCNSKHLREAGGTLTLPLWAQCSLPSCTALSQPRCEDELGNRYCNNEHLLEAGGTLAVPLNVQCSLPSCTAPSQGHCEDELGKRYCNNKHLLEAGGALAVPLWAQCSLPSCTARSQALFKDEWNRGYCNNQHLREAGGTLVTPLWALCSAPSCTQPAQHRCQYNGQPYCSDSCLPEAERLRRQQAVFESFGVQPCEDFLDDEAVLICTAALLELPDIKRRLADGSAYNFYAKGIRLDTPPDQVLPFCLSELSASCFGRSAVLRKADGSRFGAPDLRDLDVELYVGSISRVNNNTGRSKMEGWCQILNAQEPLGRRLYTTVSATTAIIAPEYAKLLVLATLPGGVPDGARVKELVEPYVSEQRRWAARCKQLPPLAELAARLPALAAQHQGRMPFLNLGGLSVEAAWAAYQAEEKARSGGGGGGAGGAHSAASAGGAGGA
jgi:hypothetical protein